MLKEKSTSLNIYKMLSKNHYGPEDSKLLKKQLEVTSNKRRFQQVLRDSD
jgi:hypothetical protein